MLKFDSYSDVDTQLLEQRVRDWSMGKMAAQFQSWKKTLYRTYVKRNKTPDWDQLEPSPLKKTRPYWEDFVAYKLSEESEEKIARNKANAAKKKYHHHMGSGGYEFIEKK